MSRERGVVSRIDCQRARDQDAQAEVFALYIQRVVQVARSHLRARAQRMVGADAVGASAFASFFLHHTNETHLTDTDELWSTLVAITLRHCEKHNGRLRAGKRKGIEIPIGRASADVKDGGDVAICPDPPDPGPAPEADVILADYAEAFLRQLSPRHRAIVEARIQGQTFRQISEHTGAAKSTVCRLWGEIEALFRRWADEQQ